MDSQNKNGALELPNMHDLTERSGLVAESMTQDESPRREPPQTPELDLSAKKNKESETLKLRNLKVWPPYETKELTKININYSLYLDLLMRFIKIICWQASFSIIFSIATSYWLDYPEGESQEAFFLILYGYYTMVAGIVLKFIIRCQEKTAIKTLNEDLQLTENMFSLQVKSEEKGITTGTFDHYLTCLLLGNTEGLHLKNMTIIYLQDLHYLKEFKDELLEVEKQLSKTKSNTGSLEQRKVRLDRQIYEETIQISRGQRFGGKTIINFQTMEDKMKFKKILHESQSTSLSCKETVEPDDFDFENAYYPKEQRTKRIVVACFVSLVVAFLTIFLILPRVQAYFNHILGEIIPADLIESILAAILLALFQFLLKKFYERIVERVIDSHRSRYDLYRLAYLSYNNLLLYIIVPLFTHTMKYGDLAWELNSLSIGYGATILISQVVQLLLNLCISEPEEEEDPACLDHIKKKIRESYTEFNLIDSVSDASVLMALAMTYPMPYVKWTDSWIMIVVECCYPLVIVVFIFLIAMLAKHRIIEHTVPFKLKSLDCALKSAFRVFECDCLPFFAGGIILAQGNAAIQDKDKCHYYIVLGVNFALGIVLLLIRIFSKSFYERAQEEIYERNKKILYSDVVKSFPSRYADKDPVPKITRKE